MRILRVSERAVPRARAGRLVDGGPLDLAILIAPSLVRKSNNPVTFRCGRGPKSLRFYMV